MGGEGSRTGHVLDDDPRPLRDQDEVRQAVHDHRPRALLDRVWEHGECGRQRAVPAREDVDVGALGPRHVRGGVNDSLDFGAVKVYGGLLLEERAGEAEDVPEDGPLWVGQNGGNASAGKMRTMRDFVKTRDGDDGGEIVRTVSKMR